MNIVVVDEVFSGPLESQLEQSVLKLINDAKETEYSLRNILKLNVYVNARDENELADVKEELDELLKNEFSQYMPAVTLVSQAPVSGNQVLTEGVFLEEDANYKIERSTFNKHSYVVLSSGKDKPRLVISGGINIPGAENFVFECQRVFDFAEQLLLKEDLDFSNIVYQKNYIPGIFFQSRYGNEEIMNINIFDNIRSLYFSPELFKSGYPELTATGTITGNVTLEFAAVSKGVPSENGTEGDYPAHLFENIFSYSTLPAGMKRKDIREQTEAMVKDITDRTHFDQIENKKGILRIYLMDRNDLPKVKSVNDKNINAAKIVYLEAGISNDNRIFMETVK